MAAISIETFVEKKGSSENTFHTSRVKYIGQKVQFIRFWKDTTTRKCSSQPSEHEAIFSFHAKVTGARGLWIYKEFSKRVVETARMQVLKRLHIISIRDFTNDFSTHILDFSVLGGYLPSLTYLELCRIRVRGLKDIVHQLSHIQLSSVVLQEGHATKFSFSNNLQALILNSIPSFSETIFNVSNCKQLEVVDIFRCRLKSMPIVPMDGVLSFLNVSQNHISDIPIFPSTLVKIIVSHNQLSRIPDLPCQVVYLDFSRNPVKGMPTNLLNCRRLKNLYFFNTEMELNVLEARYVMRLQERYLFTQNTTYTDSENVHDTFVQKSFVQSCHTLFMDPVNNEIRFTTLGSSLVDQIVNENCKSTETHIILECTFKELFERVWQRVDSVTDFETKQHLLKRLAEELIEGSHMCLTGKMCRIVNALVGFFEDIRIQISDSDQIRARIVQHINSRNGQMDSTALFEELQELEVNPQTIREWIESFKNELESEQEWH